MWPALPSAPSRRRPSSTMPPPTPVDTTMAMKSRSPRAAPRQPSPSASALASLSMCTASPSASASRARSGKSRQPGMLSGETGSPPPGHRPAGAHAARDLVARCGPRPRPRGGRPAPASPSATSGVGHAARATQLAVRVDHAGRQLGAADVEGEHGCPWLRGTYCGSRGVRDGALGLPCPGRAPTRRGAPGGHQPADPGSGSHLRRPPPAPCSTTSSGSSRASPR